MTHSDEVINVINGSHKPGATDVTAGVMTPHKKNLRDVCTQLLFLRHSEGCLSHRQPLVVMRRGFMFQQSCAGGNWCFVPGGQMEIIRLFGRWLFQKTAHHERRPSQSN